LLVVLAAALELVVQVDTELLPVHLAAVQVLNLL